MLSNIVKDISIFNGENIEYLKTRINDEVRLMFMVLWDCMSDCEYENYNLVITGTLGSGKSTICDILSIYIDCLCYPEFLSSSNIGQLLLEQKLSGNISSACFQRYILDNWEIILKKNFNKKFKLFERCIDDGLICFSNLDNKFGRMSDLEMYENYNKIRKINKQYSVPSYFDKNLNFIKVENTDLNNALLEIIDIIISDLYNNIENRIIGIDISFDLSLNRIITRARKGEEHYDKKSIELYHNCYKNLFELLEQQHHINRFLDIGKLI